MSLASRLAAPSGTRQTLAAVFLLVGMTVTVGTALLFQYIGGYIPCALCLQQRWPYYAAIPIALLAAILAAGRAPGAATRGLVLVIGLVMLCGMGLGIYHAGVEWGFWPGPAGCSAAGGVDLGGDLLSAIDETYAPSCDEAAGRFLGLSFAGWNVVASLLFAAVALRSAFSRADRFA